MSPRPNVVALWAWWWAVVLGMLALAVVTRAQQPVTAQNVTVDRCADASKILTWGLNYPDGTGLVQLVPADGSKRIYLCSGRVQLSAAGTLQLVMGTGTTCLTAPDAVDRIVVTTAGEPVYLSAGGLMGTLAISDPGAAICGDRSTTMWIRGHIRYVQE